MAGFGYLVRLARGDTFQTVLDVLVRFVKNLDLDGPIKLEFDTQKFSPCGPNFFVMRRRNISAVSVRIIQKSYSKVFGL